MKWQGYLLLAICWLWLIASSASAAVSQNLVVTAQTPQAPKASIVNGTGVVTLTATTNFVTLYTGGANGSIVNSVVCTSNDTAAHNNGLVLAEEKAGALTTLLPLGVYSIAAASATSVTNTNGNLLGTAIPGLALDSDGNPVLPLNNGDVLVIGVLTTAVTASDVITCFAKAADF